MHFCCLVLFSPILRTECQKKYSKFWTNINVRDTEANLLKVEFFFRKLLANIKFVGAAFGWGDTLNVGVVTNVPEEPCSYYVLP